MAAREDHIFTICLRGYFARIKLENSAFGIFLSLKNENLAHSFLFRLKKRTLKNLEPLLHGSIFSGGTHFTLLTFWSKIRIAAIAHRQQCKVRYCGDELLLGRGS